ncbi:MAG: PilZ domain-containing protein [Pseudomonadota bacterium]
MLTEPEQRDFNRMQQEAPMRYRMSADQPWQDAELLDLSASGLALRVRELIPLGAVLHFEIVPSMAVVPPLRGSVEVMRSEPGDQGHILGCRFLDLN